MEKAINPRSSVAIVGAYHPHAYGFGAFQKGVRPADLEMK